MRTTTKNVTAHTCVKGRKAMALGKATKLMDIPA
jgi:hypothetical protein